MYGRVGVGEVVIHHPGVDLSLVSIKELACIAREGSVANEFSNTVQLVFVFFARVSFVDLVPHFRQLVSGHEGRKEFVEVGRSRISLNWIWDEGTFVSHFVRYM